MAVEPTYQHFNGGWNAARLDDLARQVEKLHTAVQAMRDEEMREMRDSLLRSQQELKQARSQPKLTFYAFAAPLIAGVIPVLVLILSGHA